MGSAFLGPRNTRKDRKTFRDNLFWVGFFVCFVDSILCFVGSILYEAIRVIDVIRGCDRAGFPRLLGLPQPR